MWPCPVSKTEQPSAAVGRLFAHWETAYLYPKETAGREYYTLYLDNVVRGTCTPSAGGEADPPQGEAGDAPAVQSEAAAPSSAGAVAVGGVAGGASALILSLLVLGVVRKLSRSCASRNSTIGLRRGKDERVAPRGEVGSEWATARASAMSR